MTVDPVSLAINAALIAANAAVTASQEFEGPRLDDLSVTTADYGTPMNYAYGTRRFDGVSCIWAEPLREVKQRRKTKGGKYNEYSYFGTWAVAVVDHEIDAVTRIWFDRNLVVDYTGAGPVTPFADLGDIAQFIRIYRGTADQDVDPRMSATIDAQYGEGSTPAYRGVSYIVFEDVPLEKLGNRLPQVSVEVVCNGANAYPAEERTARTGFGAATAISYSPDGTRVCWVRSDQLDIWDVSARALMVHTDLVSAVSIPSLPNLCGVGADGRIYLVGSKAGDRVLAAYPADGIGGPTTTVLPIEGDFALPLTDGAGVERVFVTQGVGPFEDGAYVNPAVTLLETAAHTGASWQITWYFKDLYGDIWAAGGGGSLADDVLALWRVIDTGVRPGPSVAFLTMDAGLGSAYYANVKAFHYADADHDHLVVNWDGGFLLRVDLATLTIIDSVAGAFGQAALGPATWSAIQPGAASFWIKGYEYSSADLSEIRHVDLADWGHPLAGPQHTVYDRKLHALIGWAGSGAPDDFVWYYLDRVAGDGVALQSIVEDVSERCGLDVANDVDASDLTQTVNGYSWTQGSGKAILQPLLEAYDSEARPHDFKIEFLRRGDATLGSVPVADMGAASGNAKGSTRYTAGDGSLDTDLPLKVSMTFADLDRDQQPNTALAQRAGAATDSRRELSLDASTLALDPDEARQMADGYLRRAWMKAQPYELSLSRKWSKLEPGDAYVLVLDDVQRKAKLTRLEFGANGVLSTKWERYAPAVHGVTALPGAPADGMTPGEVVTFGYSKGVVLDVPLVTDGDDGTIVYAAAAPYSPGAWPGALIMRSFDGVEYDDEFASISTAQAGTIGYATTALSDALATVWDRTSTVTVALHSGELASATEVEVKNGANCALIGDELVRFTTATLVDANTYELSGFLRGRRGTEWATASHASGDRFVLMETAVRAEMEASDIGEVQYFKPVTQGGAAGFVQSFTYTAASRKPYAPAHATAQDVGGDIVFEWVRRTRIGGSWRDYQDASLGETTEEYEVDILDAGGSVLRTYDSLSSPTATYDAADQASDGGLGVTAKIYQIAPDLTLRGYPATVAL